VFLYAAIGGETVMRAYTPTSQDKDLGHFDLVVKIYRCGFCYFGICYFDRAVAAPLCT
jgi:hypothetical protein